MTTCCRSSTPSRPLLGRFSIETRFPRVWSWTFPLLRVTSKPHTPLSYPDHRSSWLVFDGNKTIWGEDANKFKPGRWLSDEPRKGPNIGIYAGM